MKTGVRQRAVTGTRLATLVDEGLLSDQLAGRAHPGDWPSVVGEGCARGVERVHWDRALGDIARDILGRPSRFFRCRLTELAWQLGGGPGEPPPLLGALVEIVHAGSLIVDDIQDGSQERRGAPAVHLIHGMPRALNAGNWMYFWALSTVDGLEPATPGVRDRIRGRLVQTMFDCHLGQALDLTARIDRLAQAEVPALVATTAMLKTGALMGFAARLGAAVAGAPAEHEEGLARFGRRLGVGLQMLDDFGNLTGGSEGNTSKALEDLRNGRVSWAWAFAAKALDAGAFADLQASAREVAASPDGSGARARSLAAALRIAVGRAGRAETSRYLDEALADLRRTVGDRHELEAVRSEIARLEVSYG